MKFTTMQKALSVGAIGAVASVPAMADVAQGGQDSELVLYVTRTGSTNGGVDAAYSRGLQVLLGTISGTVNGGATARTISTDIGSMISDVGGITTTGYGIQTSAINLSYSLPDRAADATLTSFLADAVTNQQTVKWSIQAGIGGGNGASYSRKFITTSLDAAGQNFSTGVSVTNTNLGMGTTEANVWADLALIVAADNTANSSTLTMDGTSINNSSYLSTTLAGVDGGKSATNWFSTANNTQNGTQVIAQSALGSSANFYVLASCCGGTQSGGSRAYVITLNDVLLASDGTLTSNLSYTPPAVPIPAASWLLLSGLGGLGVIGRKKKTS